MLLLHKQKKFFLRLSFTSKKNISRTSDYSLFFWNTTYFERIVFFKDTFLHSLFAQLFNIYDFPVYQCAHMCIDTGHKV